LIINLLNHFGDFQILAKDKAKEMEKLLDKEKQLHKEIRADFKKINQKINDDFDKVQKLKLKK
jgi:hypothetical protein